MAEQGLRVGVCGLGFMGRTHLAHLATRGDVTITALADRDASRLAFESQESGGNLPAPAVPQEAIRDAARYDDAFELVRAANVDAVLITLPTPLHARLTEAALAAGKHVLCEKPMALTLTECDQMLAAAERHPQTLMIAQCIRFWPEYEAIAEVVRSGRLGKLYFAALRRITGKPQFGAQDWYADGQRSGGALLDLHVHDIDFAQALFGPPAALQASGNSGHSGAVDHVHATYFYPDDFSVQLEGSWLYHHPFPFEMALVVSGAGGTVHWSSWDAAPPKLYAGAAEPELLPLAAGSGWGRTVDYFVECVRAGAPVQRCLPSESRRAVELALLERQAIAGAGRIDVSL